MKKVYISQVDTIFANGSYPIEFLLYYKSPIKTKKIRRAVKKLRSTFWPVFGIYDSGKLMSSKYIEADCFDSEERNASFDPKISVEQMHNQFVNLTPTVMAKNFFLKVIQFENGTVIIAKLNHLAGDGYSYFYFLSVLAAITASKPIPFKKWLIKKMSKPRHNRTTFQEFQFDNSISPVAEISNNYKIEIEEISRAEVGHFIEDIVTNINHKITENDVLSAMALKKIFGHQQNYKQAEFRLAIPIDVRRHIKEYGPKYFGNALLLNEITFDAKELADASVTQCAVKIRNAMPYLTQKSFINYVENLESWIANNQHDRLRPYNPEYGCLVTNLSKVPMDKLNFGVGKPDFIYPLTVGRNSAIILRNNDTYSLRLIY